MILGITPARGGSKGLPCKNIKEIAGKPLIAWTIEVAQQSGILDKYIVSTEDEEIAKIACSYGAEVLMRPAHLAGDDVLMLDVLQHLVSVIPCETVVLLQPTSPIRSKGLIDDCIRDFIRHDYDSLATGYMCRNIEYTKDAELSKDGKELLRQDVKGFFCDDGNVYVIKTNLIKQGDRYGKRIGRKIISRWENVEIDDDFDFFVTEQILLRLQRGDLIL